MACAQKIKPTIKVLIKKCIIWCFVLTSIPIQGQDFSDFDGKPKLKLSGNIGMRLGAYHASRIDNRRDPFSYLFTGNVNLNIQGWNIPFSFSLSQQENRFFQPFHHYGMSPKYKWITLHLGYRTMNFSPYTLNGHIFFGAGAELRLPTNTGPIISLAGFSGRLRRAVEPEDVFLNGGSSSYKRTGFGGKINIQDRKNARNYFQVDMIKAKDDANSIKSLFIDFTLQPEENLALGLSGQLNPVRNVIVRAVYGYSAHTSNTRFNESETSLPDVLRPLRSLFTPNVSTEYSDAIEGSVSYNRRTFSASLNYKRIDPAYQSFGSYYFQNDLENITLQLSKAFHKSSLRLSGRAGIQRNNLEKDKNTQTRRVIGALSVNQSLFDRLSYSFNFNNYSSSLKVVREELSDSLNLYQITQNISLSTNYLLSPSSGRTVWYTSFSLQNGNRRDEYEILDSETKFFHATTGLRWRNPAKYLTLNGALNYSSRQTDFHEDIVWGPSLAANRKFFHHRLDVGYTLTLSNNTKGGANHYWLIDNRANLGYHLDKLGSVRFTISHLRKSEIIQKENSYAELRAILSYNYRFNE